MTYFYQLYKKYHLLGLLTLLILCGISGCSLPAEILPDVFTPPTEAAPDDVVAKALVQFYVKIPQNTPAEQPILMSVLDEVTGLALNTERYPMQALGEGEYRLELPLIPGTTLKYRYSRQGDILAEEHITDGRAVRYRIYHVNAPGEVHDVISRWNDTPFDGDTGRIAGTVTDADNGEPIPGLLVAAGGAQAITTGEGGFLIEGLPPGTHNLVILSPDGNYQTFQQGAVIAAESTTPAPIELSKTDKVDITFILQVPENTPPSVPIRLAGNLRQLGNSFADLSGGVNTLATRMPTLMALPDGTYGLILSLPVGADVRYKFTLGDGFWNAERGLSGKWRTRQLIVPEAPTRVDNTVETWHVGSSAPITFDVTVPGYTPDDEAVFIQFNPYGWTEPLPMWHLGGERWAFILFSPLDMVDKLGYRYCRAGQCGHADDERTPGAHTSGQVVETAEDPQGIPDSIKAWAWLGNDPGVDIELDQIVVDQEYEKAFAAGIALQSRFHPSWISRMPAVMEDLRGLRVNWLILTPSWTFTSQNPPVMQPVSGQDPTWQDSVDMIKSGVRNDLNVAIHPGAHFPTQIGEWWRSARRDFPWWVSWFDRFETYAIHHAILAEESGAENLIFGGEWMSPAMPSGLLDDGSPSGVPPDADSRYQDLIRKIRARFNGRIGWALSYPEDVINAPDFIKAVDFVYILWDEPLTESAEPSLSDMQAAAEKMISDKLYPFWLEFQDGDPSKEIILSLAYPSIEGGATSCLADPHEECIPPSSLNYPAPDYALLDLDLKIQAWAYHAALSAISQHAWIHGVVSRDYYPPTVLQDKSTSVHGKPAEEVLKAWFIQFLEASQ